MSIEENKALVLRYFAEMDRGNIDIVDEIIAEEYIDHNPALPGIEPGREGTRRYMQMLKTAFPDATHTIDDIIAEGNKVMTRVTARGTFLGECMGHRPNGNVVEISGIALHRVEHGRIVEHWAQADIAGFMQQITAEAEPAAAHGPVPDPARAP